MQSATANRQRVIIEILLAQEHALRVNWIHHPHAFR